MSQMPAQGITFFGVTASPYQLKMQALADAAGLPWQRWPDHGSRWQNTRLYVRLRFGTVTRAISRFPGMIKGMDEYPGVPFYSFDRRSLFYDSSGLASHLDQLGVTGDKPLVPQDPAVAFVCRLIDEAFDEFGLYMVHHHRWVTSARTNVMGEMTAAEMRRLLPPGMARVLAIKLPQRQVRRCPYLFSVASPGFECGMPAALTPPAREGFPSTHGLLDQSWYDYLDAMESVLAEQPFILGDRFTLADASAYGQLAMNLPDGRAEEILAERAPRTRQWLDTISAGEHSKRRGETYISPAIAPLVAIIAETFMPLMAQNAQAHTRAVSAGETAFNEAAFDAGKALYDGHLRGQPFRAVVKTFQVQVWRELLAHWSELADEHVNVIKALYPVLEQFDAAHDDYHAVQDSTDNTTKPE